MANRKIRNEPRKEVGAKTGRKPDNRQGSPIVIGGGGSIGIDFSEAYYQLVPHTNKFQNANDSVEQVWVIDKHGVLDNATPFQPTGWVEIQCLDSGGTKPIRIYSKPLAIEFDPIEFPSKAPTGGSKKIRLCEKRTIGKDIIVWDFAGAVTPRVIDAQDGKCTIVVVNKL